MLTLPVNKQKGAMWAVDFKLLGSMWRKQCSEFKTAFSASACIPWWLRRNLYYTLWPASLPTKIQARIMCPHLPDLWTSCQIFAAVFVLWLFASAELWQLTPENCLKSWKKTKQPKRTYSIHAFHWFLQALPTLLHTIGKNCGHGRHQ